MGAMVAARCAVDVVRNRLDGGAVPEADWLSGVFTVAGLPLRPRTTLAASPGSNCVPAKITFALPVARTGVPMGAA